MKAIFLWWRKRRLKSQIYYRPSYFWYVRCSAGDALYADNTCIPKTKLWDNIRVTKAEIFNKRFQGRKRGEYMFEYVTVVSFDHTDGWGLKAIYKTDWGWITTIGVYDKDNKKLSKLMKNAVKGDPS